MPPKVRVTKDEILNAAVELVRREGEGALNARSLAGVLGCSTQPLFTHFPTMKALKYAVIGEASRRWLACIERETATAKWPPYKASGMAYWRFATEERELFRLLFMRDRTGEEHDIDTSFETAVTAIQQANGLDRAAAERFHLVMWSTVHGLAVMCATAYLPLTEERVSALLTDAYTGLSKRYKEDAACSM